MSLENSKEFQTAQKEVVAMIGSFLVPLNSFFELDAYDLSSIRDIQMLVGEFINKLGEISRFCNEQNYPAYYHAIRRPAHQIHALLGNQLLPSKQLETSIFRDKLSTNLEGISEVMIAVAQIKAPFIDVNIRANNSFSAYCFVSSMLDSATSTVIIIDPYVDQSIFYRYLYRLEKSINIKVITDTEKFSAERLKSYESVEKLFMQEYPNYERKLFSNLHDRYLIIDLIAYSLGGSLKDAARNADFSITQVTENKKIELLQIYA